MDPLIKERLTGIVINLCLLAAFLVGWFRHPIGRSARLACTCGYDPSGLGNVPCPECGRTLHPTRIIEAALDDLKGRLAALFLLAALGVAISCLWLAGNFHVINDIARHGRDNYLTEFRPPNSSDPRGALITITGICLWAALLLAMYFRLRRRVAQERARLYAMRPLSPR